MLVSYIVVLGPNFKQTIHVDSASLGLSFPPFFVLDLLMCISVCMNMCLCIMCALCAYR